MFSFSKSSFPPKSELKGYRNASGGTSTSEIYNTVKHVFDQKLGLMSQGINSRHVISERGPTKGYFGNLLLKVKGKENEKENQLIFIN